MVSTVRTRTVAVVCAALSVISIAAVVGLSALVDVYTQRHVDLAARVLDFAASSHDETNPLDPVDFAKTLPRNTTVIFADRGGTHTVWSTSSSRSAESDVDSLLRQCAPTNDIVDATMGGHPVRARALRFDNPVVIGNRTTGWRATADTAVVALGARSATKLTRVMAAVAAITGIATMIGAAAATTVLVRRTMSPLTRLTTAVQGLGPRPRAGSLPRGAGSRFREAATLTEAIADLVDRRARAEEELREFIANTSHELRTPLTKIQGWSELYFQRPPTAVHTDRAMQSIVEECDRMRAMIDGLSMLARAQEIPELATEDVDVCALCRTVAEDVAVISPGCRVRTDIPEQPILIAAHSDRITQVLRNIVGNSLVHGGPDVCIGIRVAADSHGVSIDVTDDGHGIPAEHHPSLFARNYSAAEGGSGLGLAIVRAIVTSYGGDVSLRSVAGEGTAVTLHFP